MSYRCSKCQSQNQGRDRYGGLCLLCRYAETPPAAQAVTDGTCGYCHTARDHQPLCPMAAHVCGAPHPFREGMRCQRPRDHQDGVRQLDTHHCRDRGWPATASEMATVEQATRDIAAKPQRAYPVPAIGADFGRDGRIIITGTPSLNTSATWQYRDDHVDALSFAAGFRRAGKTDLMAKIAGMDVQHITANARSMICPGCTEHVEIRPADDRLTWHSKPRTTILCGWSDQLRTTAETAHAEREMRLAAEMLPVPASMLPEFLTVGGNDPGPPVFYSCAQCGAGMDADAARASLFCKGCKAKPPTLREWLGDRVSELGRWADVLREQPVPAGRITSWRWMGNAERGWTLHMITRGCDAQVLPQGIPLLHTETGPWADAMQMALFTRHPDVKLDPPKARHPWSPEDQHETIARDA